VCGRKGDGSDLSSFLHEIASEVMYWECGVKKRHWRWKEGENAKLLPWKRAREKMNKHMHIIMDGIHFHLRIMLTNLTSDLLIGLYHFPCLL
jgi:hypothetical protein